MGNRRTAGRIVVKTGGKAPALKCLAASLGLCFALGAHAQSSVTLYGVIDGGLLYTSKTANPVTGQNEGRQFSMVDSSMAPSQWGMTGTEDLGGGYKARFKIESGFSMANGSFNNSSGNAFGREAWVALDGGFGEVKAGLQMSPFFLAVYASDPRKFSLFGSGLVPYVDAVLGTGIFNSNAVSYTSPRIYGFEGSAMLALGGVAGDFPSGRQYSFNLNYTNGSLMVVASMYDGNAGGTVQTPIPSSIGFIGRTLGVSYKWGRLTAKASFTNYKVAGSFNDDVYGGGLDFLATPAFDVDGGVWYTSDRNQTTNHSVLAAVGAQYFLSHATTLYAQVAVANNHGAMNTGLSINDATYGTAGTTTGVNVGMRHVF